MLSTAAYTVRCSPAVTSTTCSGACKSEAMCSSCTPLHLPAKRYTYSKVSKGEYSPGQLALPLAPPEPVPRQLALPSALTTVTCLHSPPFQHPCCSAKVDIHLGKGSLLSSSSKYRSRNFKKCHSNIIFCRCGGFLPHALGARRSNVVITFSN